MEYSITNQAGVTIKRRVGFEQPGDEALVVLLAMLPLTGKIDINSLVNSLIEEHSLNGEWRKRMFMTAWGATTAQSNMPLSQASIEQLGADFATGWAFQVLLADKVIECQKS